MIQISTIHAVWQASSSYHFLSQNNCLLSCSASFSPPAHCKWELLRRLHSKSLDSGSLVALIRGGFCLHVWKYQEELKVRKGFGVWSLLLGFFLNFKLLGKSIIRESFWDSLMLGKASGDANKSSCYICNHPRRKKRLFHWWKQVNPAFSQSEYASLEERLLKAGQRWRCSLQILVLSSPWVTSIENEALICFNARPKLHCYQVAVSWAEMVPLYSCKNPEALELEQATEGKLSSIWFHCCMVCISQSSSCKSLLSPSAWGRLLQYPAHALPAGKTWQERQTRAKKIPGVILITAVVKKKLFTTQTIKAELCFLYIPAGMSVCDERKNRFTLCSPHN